MEEFSDDIASELTLPFDPTPWRPFLSRYDYEVADFALRCSMNKERTEEFLRLLEEARKGAETNLKTHDQLQALWDAAADRLTRVRIDSSDLMCTNFL